MKFTSAALIYFSSGPRKLEKEYKENLENLERAYKEKLENLEQEHKRKLEKLEWDEKRKLDKLAIIARLLDEVK